MKRKLLLIVGLLVALAAAVYQFLPRKPAAPLVSAPPKIDIRQLQEEWIPVQRAILTGKADEALAVIQRHPEWLKESRFRNLVMWAALRKNAVPIVQLCAAQEAQDQSLTKELQRYDGLSKYTITEWAWCAYESGSFEALQCLMDLDMAGELPSRMNLDKEKVRTLMRKQGLTK